MRDSSKHIIFKTGKNVHINVARKRIFLIIEYIVSFVSFGVNKSMKHR